VALLMLFVLPNPLRVPQNNPTATAEYAPVPGNNTDDANNANFGETGLANSSGIGAGGNGAGLLPGSPPFTRPPPPQFRPRQKVCVGNPPRQTEDPLSPPCVPYFEGDNGGATWQGITDKEILIVFYNDLGVEGDLSTPYSTSDEKGNQGLYEQTVLVRTLKAQLRYFSKRYQTYGRNVRMIAYPSDGGPATPPTQRRGEALVISNDIKTFATASLVENAQDFYVEMAKRKIPSFGWNEDVPKKNYDETAPYVWSFGPDQETETNWSAEFICRKLNGETAKWAADPDLTERTRTFGLIYPATSQRGPTQMQLALLLKQYVKDKCGASMQVATYNGSGGGAQAANIMAKFKQDHITTVTCYCIPVITETTVTHMQNAATSLNYFPEWFWDHSSAMDRPSWQQIYGSKRHPGFGVSYLWRQGPFTESHAYRAYTSEEPGTQPNTRFNFEIYHIFLNLFEAIQAAGPILTPDTVQNGMYTFKYIHPKDPWLPTGSYGPDGPSPFTFLDTAMAWWWDPTGTPPGGQDGEGCNRLLYGGRRFYGADWPRGDTDGFFDKSLPCSEDTRKIANPQGSTRI
jgi:hypothetical protein